jgi:hypothetical protein
MEPYVIRSCVQLLNSSGRNFKGDGFEPEGATEWSVLILAYFIVLPLTFRASKNSWEEKYVVKWERKKF